MNLIAAIASLLSWSARIGGCGAMRQMMLAPLSP
jgi:hypothetical protein